MMGSLYSGITGLKANGDIMNILGNNIANVNTIGFKKSSGSFFDILSTSLSGGGSNMQVGRGTYMGSVKTEFLQGAFERTESVTDIAIEGDGFFVVKDPNPNMDNLYYTRNGEFLIDKDGYLVTTDGMRVQGYMINPTSGDIDYTLESDVQITNALAASHVTSEVELGVNLSAESEVGSSDAFSTTLVVYDSQGREIPLTFTFTKTATNAWNVSPSISGEYGAAGFGNATPVSTAATDTGATVPPREFTVPNIDIATSSLTFYENDGAGGVTEIGPFNIITSGTPAQGEVLVQNDTPAGFSTLTFNASEPALANIDAGTHTLDVDYIWYDEGFQKAVTFDSNGNLATIDGAPVPPNTLDISMYLTTGATSPQDVTVDVAALSQYSSPSVTNKLVQNGFGAGELRNLEFSPDGYITGHYTNGLSQEIGRLFLGHFRNPNGLAKVGETRYLSTRESGQAIHNTPGTGLATIDSYSLELANVDIAAEFVKLITAQRAYTANAKVVSTSDQMLGDLMTVKH